MSNMRRCKEIIDKIIAQNDEKIHLFISPSNMGNGLTVYAYGGDVVCVYVDGNKIKFDLYKGKNEDYETGKVTYGYHDYMSNGAEIYDEYTRINHTNEKEVTEFYRNNWKSIIEGVENWSKGDRIGVGDKTYHRYERKREIEIAYRNNKLSKDYIAIVAVECAIKTDTMKKIAKPDMIGVYVKDGKVIFQYIEYKCTPGGNNGTTLKNHFTDMLEYLDDRKLKELVLKYVKEMIDLKYISMDDEYKSLISNAEESQVKTEMGFWFSHMRKKGVMKGAKNEYVCESSLKTRYDELQAYIETECEKINDKKNQDIKDRIKYVFLDSEEDIVNISQILPTVLEWDNGEWRLK